MKKIFVLLPLVLMLAACGKEPKPNDVGNNSKAPAAAPGVAKEIITFKGIPLGKPNTKSDLTKLCVKEVKEDGRKWDFCEMESGISFFTAFGKLKWDAGKVLAFFVLNSQGGIDSIKMSEVDTSSILETIPLLEERYGKPEITTQSVQNRLGTQFEKKCFEWKDAQGNTLLIFSIDKEIDKGSVLFFSAAEMARRIAKIQQIEDAAKSNL